jgi:hypothetical protein
MKHLKLYENFTEKFKFWLEDENDGSCYWFYLKLKNLNEFEKAIDTSKFDDFLDKMETSDKPWSGFHDATGSEHSWMFRSNEIQDFETAIKMWFIFFKKMNLTEDKIFFSKIESGSLEEPNESNVVESELIRLGWSKEEIEELKIQVDAKKYNI